MEYKEHLSHFGSQVVLSLWVVLKLETTFITFSEQILISLLEKQRLIISDIIQRSELIQRKV